MSFLIDLSILVAFGLPLIAYIWAKYINSYWERNNVPHIPGKVFLGNMFELLRFRLCAAEHFSEFYNHKVAQNEPAVGVHIFHKPALVLRDPELIKRVLVKDFNSFSNRHTAGDPVHDIVGSNGLFFAANPAWKTIRSKVSPFFSNGKVKQMFYLMNDIGLELNSLLMTMTVNEKTKSTCVELKEICARYTTDILASCAFGVRANSLADPNSEFRKHGRAIFDFNWYRAVEFMSLFYIPDVTTFFKFKVFSKPSTDFLRESVGYVMDEREHNGIVRNDIIDMLISFRKEDKDKTIKNSKSDVVFQGDVLVSQAANLFTAGFETSSAVMSFGLYELCRRPDVQDKIRSEIKDTLAKNNGNLTYDSVQNMEYLGMVLYEIMRMYPPLPFLDRVCTTDRYAMEAGSKFIIPRGMPVFIPVYAIQRDPQYFPNPDCFDPERFAPENKDNITPYTYIPFGMGPHNCVGERFGMLLTRLGMINFFKNHRVEPSHRTPTKLKLEKKALLIQSEGGIYLNVIHASIDG